MAQKIIIDTDPGIDDAMAIHMAFADPRLDVVGLTTVFGNVTGKQATRNALCLAEMAHYPAAVAGGACPEAPTLRPSACRSFAAAESVCARRRPPISKFAAPGIPHGIPATA